jgi:hypothetical protein
MQLPINVKSPNNIRKWQVGFNSAFKGLMKLKILSTDFRKIYLNVKFRRNKIEHIKEIMGLKEKPDIIDIIERKRLQWYGHVKRMQEERLPKSIMEWIPGERRKRGRRRKTWMEGV